MSVSRRISFACFADICRFSPALKIHLPEVLASGARGANCGLANLMPRLLRATVLHGTADGF